ncbi:MAG: Cd(II)/Pb(II)-responsive transcriptional regulator [unclassified Hahellaceae]|nr:Cd(II)/Pb(II)-responsive transcriptional regulator [Hahellaceae bacterium]|tara:strand:- start:67324 stop:67749 length:426 start_codon:yes stop_codon:yes gene_type:complete
MRIGRLSQLSGVEVETIRFYEREGLLQRAEREANGYRRYQQDHLQRLAFIRHCRALDMPLQDVKRMLQFMTKPTPDCGDIDRLIEAHLANVRSRLQSLQALEVQLCSLRDQCGQPHRGDHCGIVQELKLAANGRACACHPD